MAARATRMDDFHRTTKGGTRGKTTAKATSQTESTTAEKTTEAKTTQAFAQSDPQQVAAPQTTPQVTGSQRQAPAATEEEPQVVAASAELEAAESAVATEARSLAAIAAEPQSQAAAAAEPPEPEFKATTSVISSQAKPKVKATQSVESVATDRAAPTPSAAAAVPTTTTAAAAATSAMTAKGARARPVQIKPATAAKAGGTRQRRRNKTPLKGQSDIRDHFPLRRSQRQKPYSTADKIRNQDDSMDRLEIRDVPSKGKGIFATAPIAEGEYVCEYAGELIRRKEGVERERIYDEEARAANATDIMSYMYYFKYNGADWCVDATVGPRVGRLINHSRTRYNLRTKLLVVDSTPHLGFFASKDIAVGDELCYDYGERDPETLEALPWLQE